MTDLRIPTMPPLFRARTKLFAVLLAVQFVSPRAAMAQALSTTNAPVRNIWLTFGLDRLPVLEYQPFGGVPLWQYLASLIYIFLAFYISRSVDHFVHGRVAKWAEKTATKADDLLVNLLRGPLRIVSFVVLLHVGMNVYAWPEVLAALFSKGLKIVVASSITYVVLKVIDLGLGLWHQRHVVAGEEQFGRQLMPLIRKTLKVFVVVVAALVTSQNLGLDVTGLIASLSIGGLAIGLAAQDTLGNLFGAVAVLGDKPFQVGDRIQLDAIDGTVESIGFRSTRVRNLDGHLVTVPNRTMGTQPLRTSASGPISKR